MECPFRIESETANYLKIGNINAVDFDVNPNNLVYMKFSRLSTYLTGNFLPPSFCRKTPNKNGLNFRKLGRSLFALFFQLSEWHIYFPTRVDPNKGIFYFWCSFIRDEKVTICAIYEAFGRISKRM